MIPFLLWAFAGLCAWVQWGDKIPHRTVNAREREAKYVLKVNKSDEKENMERKIKVVKDSGEDGYMTLAEYELESSAQPHTNYVPEKFTVPKVERPSDMLYVPQPSYKMVRYNNPPGSPEISVQHSLYKNQQQNEQGIVSPDFQMLVYPAVYYYPYSASVSCDIFVIPLDQKQGNLNRIMSANVANKLPDAILSTDNTQDNYGTFRTITPIDFSTDSTKLLTKEKIGNVNDGIWKTTPIVYDFEEKQAYRLQEVRDAIIHYWRLNKGLNLDDKRWDVYPLGFDAEERVIVDAYAYTGKNPVHLGLWSVDMKGMQSRLVSFEQKDIDIAMHGLKIVPDGVVTPPPKNIRASEDFTLWKIDRQNRKQKKEDDKAQIKALKKEYKKIAKQMNKDYKHEKKYYKERQKIQTSTSDTTRAAEKWAEKKAKMEAKEQKSLERQQAGEVRINARQQTRSEKKFRRLDKKQEKQQQKLEKELDYIRSLPEPDPIPLPSGIFKQ